MRKFLLLSLVTLLSSVAAMADVAVFIPNGATNYNGSAPADKTVKIPDGGIIGTTFTIDGVVSLEWTKVNNSTSQVTSKMLRWYANDILTVTPASGVTISKISFKIGGPSYIGKLSTNWGTITNATDANYSTTPETWTPGTGAQPASFTITAGAQTRIQYIEVEYTAGGSVVTPDPDPEPDPEVPVVSSIAEFINAAPTTEMKINAPVTVIYKNGRNMYVRDAQESFILVYNSKDVAEVTNLAAVNGDQLSWISGTYSPYAGLPEMVPVAIGEKTSGTPVEPYEVNISEITVADANQYVTFGPVKIESTSNAKKFTATDGENATIELYNTFTGNYYTNVEVPQGEGFYVTGFVCVNNSTLQVTPIAFEGGKVIETVATPVFSVAGAVAEGTQVEITCETEGATIYYTVDGSTPSATNGTKYTGALSISDAVVIKAIAVKADWYDSEVATAAFTIKQEGQTEATFVFCDEANGFNLYPAIEFPTESNTSVYLNEQSFTNGAVTITFDNGTNKSNKPVFFWPGTAAIKGQIEGRIYKENTISFSCADGKITSVTFDQWSNSTNWAGFTTAAEGFNAIAATDKTFTCPDGISTFVLTSTGTSRFKSITVEYVEDGGQAAIEDVVADGDANAPVEFFNLQGFPVSASNLTPGIYVCRQGSKVTKVLVK